MASWWRDVAQQLGIEGSGSWKRRIAEALQATEGNGPWAKHIAEKGIASVPADGAIVTDGQSIAVTKVDGSPFSPTVAGAAAVAGGAMTGVAVPANVAVLTDQQASIDVNQYDGTADFAATVGVAGNNPTLTLANGTTRIAVSEEMINVTAGAKTGTATVKVQLGAWEAFPLNESFALAENADTPNVQTWNGAQVVPGQIAVVGSNIQHIAIGQSHSIVTNNDAKQIPVTGTYTNTVTFTVVDSIVTGIALS